MGTWNWWLHTDAGLAARIGIGAGIFLLLAIVDLARRGREATRWREYLFLAACAGAAMAYGLLSDFVAASISWEYFYYGKGLDATMGPRVPPDSGMLHWEACKVGLKATWSVGLIIGAALLIANNPRPNRPQLPYRSLFRMLVLVLSITAAFACVGALLGGGGGLAWTSSDIAAIWRDDLFRPRRFMTVYGLNLGGYAGGILGTVVGVTRVLRRRNKA